MVIIKQHSHTTNDSLDEEALIKEAREHAQRRRHLRLRIAVAVAAVACLLAIGVVHYSSSPTKTGGDRNGASALTCPSARVKLLGVSAIPGGLGHAGVLVRASIASSAACTISGYPIVGAELSSLSTATASDVRNAYLGGFANATAPLPRLSVTSHSRIVSFTMQWADGNGPVCPQMKAFQISLPGSRGVLTARTVYEAGIGVTRFIGIYCSHLQVTPLVKGPSGSGR